MIKHANGTEFFEGFAWALPSAFLTPLGECRFEKGDILYDTPEAYAETWAEAKRHISHSIQIKYPPRRAVTLSEDDSGSVFHTNWAQEVIFSLTDEKKGSTQEITTTQGRLYTLLWKGDFGCLSAASEPQIPEDAATIRGKLSASLSYFTKRSNGESALFLMPFDRTNSVLAEKHRAVSNALSEKWETAVDLATPSEAGLKTDFAFSPTLRIACFRIACDALDTIEAALKSVLYIPSKNRKTEIDRFRIQAHGDLVSV